MLGGEHCKEGWNLGGLCRGGDVKLDLNDN